MLFWAWKASGADPFRLYHGLNEHYRPLADPTADPVYPAWPERLRAFVYACGMYARELERLDLRDLARAVAG